MRRRVAVARNLFKAWLVLAVPAAVMGFAGWRLGGYGLTLLFVGSIVLAAGAVYFYSDRVAMGMVGASELLPGEAPALHSAVQTLAGRAGVVPPKPKITPTRRPPIHQPNAPRAAHNPSRSSQAFRTLRTAGQALRNV